MNTRTQLLRTNVLGLALRGSSMLAGLAVAALAARLLGPSGLGIYATALAVVSVAGVPLQFGLPTLVLREVTVYARRQQWNLLRGLLLWAHGLVLVLSLLIALAAIAAYALADRFDQTWLSSMLWAVALTPLMAGNRLREAALQGLQHIAWAQLPDQLLTPLAYLACLAAISLIVPRPVHPQTVMAAYVLCAFIALLSGSALLARFAPTPLRRATPQFTSRAWLKALVPLSLISGFGIVNGQIDVLILSLLSTAENVGLYRAAFTAAAMTTVVGATVGNLMSTHFADFFIRSDMVRLQRLVRYSAWAAFVPALAVLLLFIIGGKTILGAVFGPTFAPANTALILLASGQTFNCAAGVVQSVLNMTGHTRDTLKGVIAGAITNIVLNVLMVPHYAAAGAAAATGIGIVVENGICCLFAWRRVRINTTVLPFFKSPARG